MAGYKQPPRHTQFKKGESGNPKGRRKGARNLKTELATLMQEKTQLKIDGKTRVVSRRLALLLRLMADAFQGNVKAASKLLDLDFRYSAEEGALIAESLEDSAARHSRVIDRFLAHHGLAPAKKSKVSK